MKNNNSSLSGAENSKLLELAVDKYSKMLFRICLVILCSREDAEDALQETFLRYMTKAPEFESPEHEKAWLIKVATNISKNMNRFRFRNSSMSLEDITEVGVEENDAGVFEMILSLPAKQKVVMVLYYVEGYNANEVADIIGISPQAVRKRLQAGRKMLKSEFEGGSDNG